MVRVALGPAGARELDTLRRDAGPGVRSQVDAIGTAIENTTPGSRHLREAVGERQSISARADLSILALFAEPVTHASATTIALHTRRHFGHLAQLLKGRVVRYSASNG